jgi:hypothetical protein
MLMNESAINGGVRDLNGDSLSRMAIMFGNLRYSMGEVFGTDDYRMWVVRINDGSTNRPPSVATPTATPASAALPTALPEIAPPPPPADAPPPTIALGQTRMQVTSAFGQPLRIVKLGVKEIYFYKDMKVTFGNGKVTNVE